MRALMGVLLGVAMCWSSNTVSHIHLHRPLFQSPAANRWFSLYLSLLLTVPQRWWKVRHLAHHGIVDDRAQSRKRWLPDGEIVLEAVLVVSMLTVVATVTPALFATVVLPALTVGYGLCAIQGHEEHARAAAGVDHHGRLYNRLWFNDGYHAAHHRRPGAHWTELTNDVRSTDVTSGWPPVLRVVEAIPVLLNRMVALVLDGLERLSMHARFARRFQLRRHTRAFSFLLAPDARAAIRSVTVVGGGLFPRTVLVLAPLLPEAIFTVVDRQAAHIEAARGVLTEAGLLGRVTFVCGTYTSDRAAPCDLLVVPLAFLGDKGRLYADPPAPLVATHDWLWHRRGEASAIVSVLLAKRINLSRLVQAERRVMVAIAPQCDWS